MGELEQLSKDLKEGKTLPLYYFEGEDEYRKRRALDRIREVALGESSEVGYEFLYDAEASDVVERASTESFFAPRRVIAVSGAENYRKEAAAAFERYLDAPPGETIIVLLAHGPADRRGGFFKAMERRGVVFSFPYLTGADRRRRIAAEADKLGMKLEADALDYLDYVLSPDLYTITGELGKLHLYRGAKTGRVTLAEVREVTALSRRENIFEVVRFVGEGRGQRAMEAVARLLDSGESELAVLGLLARQTKLFWQAKDLAEKGAPTAVIAEKLNVPRRYVDEYVEGGRRLPREELARLHSLLRSLDLRVKTGRIEPRLAVEVFAAEAALKPEKHTAG